MLRQKKWQWITALLIILASLALAGCGGQDKTSKEPAQSQGAPTGGEKAQNLNFGTTSSTSGAYAYLTAVARSISEGVANVRVTPIESGASVDNLQRMAEGQFDIGLTGHTVLYEAYKGIGQFKEQANGDLRILWAYSMLPLTMVVREDSGITSIEQLSGKDFNAGGRGSSTEQMISQAFDIIGVKPKYYLGSFDDAAQAISDKHIIGLAKNGASMTTPDSLITQIQASTKLRFLSFNSEQEDKIKKELPYFLFGTVKAGTNQNQTTDTLNIVQAAYIVGSTKQSEELAYQMVKAVWSDQKRQAAAYPAINATDYPGLTIESPVIPLHAGTVKLLKELGKEVPAELIPPEYKE